MKRNVKKASTDLLATTECNLLSSLKGVRPGDIYKQILPEVNHIGWIFGHCAVHLDWVLSLTTKTTRIFSEEVSHYHRYGTTKSEILDEGPPISFDTLVDRYLDVSESFSNYLAEMEEDGLYEGFPGEVSENLLQTILRVSLHFMGHAGQIVLIRRALGNPGSSFVSGVKKESRQQIMDDWYDWWNNRRESFQD